MEAQTESIAPRGSAVRASNLRYPLRSATKSKEVADQPAPKRSAKSVADITKSVSALEFSGKDKSSSTKPPRRLSIPTKPVSTPHATNGSSDIPKSETPLSNMSGSTTRRRFSMISSVSYWMAQIKLAEAASKHAVSLGFFKLAFEAGCEPLDRMREELKSYIVHHNLSVELHDSVKDILNTYGITEDPEQLKVAVRTKSESPKSGTKPGKSSKTTPAVPASTRNGNLRPRSLNTEAGQKASNVGSRVAVSSNKKPVKVAVVKENPRTARKEKQEDCEIENQTSLENNATEGSATTLDTVSKLEVSCEEEKENMVDDLVRSQLYLSLE